MEAHIMKFDKQFSELNTEFISPTYGIIDLEEITNTIARQTCEEPEDYRLIVGTDSKRRDICAIYVTVIILYHIGKGGTYFYQRSRSEIGKHSLQATIFHETALSLATAAKLDELLKKKGVSKLEIEIHSDVGNHGKTKKLIKEVVFWIDSSGYSCCIKPESFGASSVADKYTD
jgi:hypothetical protein